MPIHPLSVLVTVRQHSAFFATLPHDRSYSNGSATKDGVGNPEYSHSLGTTLVLNQETLPNGPSEVRWYSADSE